MDLFNLGDRVHIKASLRAPYSGETGAVCSVDSEHDYGDEIYLVRFKDGLAYRYAAHEMEVTSGTPALQGGR